MEKVLIKEICYKREAQCAPCVQNSLPQVCGEWFCMKNTLPQYCEDSFGAQNTLPQVCGDSFCTKDAPSEPSGKAPPTQGDPFGAFGQGTPDPRRPTPSFRTRHPRPGETHSGLSDKATPTQGDLLRLSQRGGTGLRLYNSCYFSSRRPSLFASEKHTSCKNTPLFHLIA